MDGRNFEGNRIVVQPSIGKKRGREGFRDRDRGDRDRGDRDRGDRDRGDRDRGDRDRDRDRGYSREKRRFDPNRKVGP